MSLQLIQQYHNQRHRVQQYSGSKKETSIRKPFQDLLEHYARQRNLELIAELDYRTRSGHLIYPDGTLKDALRQDWGYWESKDEDDDLDQEIAKKFAKGYPQSNILFEDSHTAVLIQNGTEVGRVPLLDAPTLDTLLTQFVSYENAELRQFREAIENFTQDIPALGEMLRDIIRAQYEQNPTFQKATQEFLELCQEAINPSMELADVREMIVQHVLTQDIFITIFDDPQFHNENIIAQELGDVVGTFYKGQVRRQIDGRIEGYTRAIKARAAQIYNHHEKQKFLKVLYENFYKAYNPQAADRLGIVYTPNEIVRFMIQAADHLCYRHFEKGLGDKGVDILDPATGTGTFITELIELLPPHQLAHKYAHELHCNEVSILPYYIANLNIEYSYRQKMGQYVPFENILFVDTLDNMGFKTQHRRQLGLFGLTDENLARIERQNAREISVIIGNPPYNAWQENFNMQNPNRPYKEVDERIKNTYVKQGTAQNKIAVYDMYVRFVRWATDRLASKGMIAFVSNSSFIDAATFDGFRKVVAQEFNSIYVVNLKGNARTSGERRRREGGNIFSDLIRVGVAIYFLVKDDTQTGCKVFYAEVDDYTTAEQKIAFIRDNPLAKMPLQTIIPNRRQVWVNQTDNDFYDLLPVISKDEDAIFKLYSNGVKTQRDEWVYDFSAQALEQKMRYFVQVYEETRANPDNPDKMQIKWDADMEQYLKRGIAKRYNPAQIVPSIYRPFIKQHLYFDQHFNGRTYQLPHIFPTVASNQAIWFKTGTNWPFFALAVDCIPDLLPQGGSQCLPLYRYDNFGNQVDNITDWALKAFRTHYQNQTAETSTTSGASKIQNPKPKIEKQDIFHYVYAVLHHPAYRAKYKLNLKREFPRIPFYDDFTQWATWGEQLMALHLQYETAPPFPLQRHETDPETSRKAYKAKLKADKAQGIIELDTLTSLSGVPASAWAYKLGNRSALEWVLDRYKERKPRDPTIRERFNTYRFADYKEQVIDLLQRLVTVSVQTMQIIAAMPSGDGDETPHP